MFHTGIRVPNLDAAMAELGDDLRLKWAEVRDMPEQTIWTPSGGMETVSLRFTYSCEGPQHVELLEGAPGSFWDGKNTPGVHHVGLWCDDVPGQTAAAVANGWTCVGAAAAPEDGFGLFSYIQPPSGVIVELVSAVILPAFEQWWVAGLETE